MVIPVATALLLDLGFKKTLTSAVISGVISVLLGLTISFYGDLAPGGSIILTSLALFLLVLMGKKIRVCFKQHP
ncbi:MAG TPA: metal ABC transporter permease, partial [Clostridia bacterium]|nr:metal ABC transporter permease [Clostridia bacterium]